MNTRFLLQFATLIASLGVWSCLHDNATIQRVLLHLAAGDCAEIAHIHKGNVARTVETFCNGAEGITEYQVTIERDAGKD